MIKSQSRRSVRTVRTKRSAWAFACRARIGVWITFVHEDPDSLDPVIARKLQPSINARYSATSWVAGPISFEI
jgi:hypothetical protein